MRGKEVNISCVIPHWPKSIEHDQALVRCIDSLRGYDELIVERNDGIGFAKAVNLGLKKAKGDYICVINNDTVMERGDLKYLCKPDTIVVPCMRTGQVDNMPRAFYCMPRSIYEEVGGYDERFEIGYFEDDDLIRRWQAAGFTIETNDQVVVSHVGGMTMQTIDHNAAYKRNKELFDAKYSDSL
jgi:GT2 family glycosyltransferase